MISYLNKIKPFTHFLRRDTRKPSCIPTMLNEKLLSNHPFYNHNISHIGNTITYRKFRHSTWMRSYRLRYVQPTYNVLDMFPSRYILAAVCVSTY